MTSMASTLDDKSSIPWDIIFLANCMLSFISDDQKLEHSYLRFVCKCNFLDHHYASVIASPKIVSKTSVPLDYRNGIYSLRWRQQLRCAAKQCWTRRFASKFIVICICFSQCSVVLIKLEISCRIRRLSCDSDDSFLFWRQYDSSSSKIFPRPALLSMLYTKKLPFFSSESLLPWVIEYLYT